MSILNRFKKDKESVEKESVAKKVAQKQGVKEAKKPAAKQKKVSKSAEKKTAKKAVRSLSKGATTTILAPVVSEKSAHLSDANVLVFRVDPKANRVQVRNAFRELYNVTPKRVNVLTVRGKRVRFGRRQGVRQSYKKAMIFLPKGVNIDIFEGV